MTNWIFIVIIATGLPLGILAKVWVRQMIQQRQPGIGLFPWIDDSWQIQVIWALAGALIQGMALIKASLSWTALVLAVWLYALMMLSVVDVAIRKIPNEMLALMIVARLFDLIIHRNLTFFTQALLGLATGYFFFSLPVLFGRSIGKGDAKLAAVIGFCIGIVGMLQSLVIMSLGIVIYYSLKLKYKRSNLKTKVAMGPYLSIGMVVSVLWPIAIP